MSNRQGIRPPNAPFFSIDPLSPITKAAFLDELWPKSPPGSHTGVNRVNEFDYYFQSVDRERAPGKADIHAITSWDDLFYLVSILKSNDKLDLRHIIATIEGGRPALAASPAKLSQSIMLVARLWLMIRVHNCIASQPYQHAKNSLLWKDEDSLKSTLENHFSPSTCIQESKFPIHMNVVDMKRIGDIQIEWTDNLALHLSFHGKSIYLYHAVSALKRIRDSVSASSFLPPNFIGETLATINLLVPLGNPRCNRWLTDEIKRWGLDENLAHREALVRDKSEYPYWQEKLLIIEETFLESKPKSLLQWWHDKRDMHQWWGFWLVVVGIGLTALFGLIQSVTGIIQVAKLNGSSK